MEKTINMVAVALRAVQTEGFIDCTLGGIAARAVGQGIQSYYQQGAQY